MILRLRMLSDENDNFVRDFEVSHEMNLLELHNFIIASIDYDDCMASFYTADEQWQPLQEFSLMDLSQNHSDFDSQRTFEIIMHKHSPMLKYK